MEFELVRRFGVRVIEVEGLEHPVIYVDGHDIALVRQGLPSAREESTARWIMTQALQERAALSG